MKSAASTQQNIPIAGVKDGLVILKNGEYRLVLSVAAINYALKSEQEQNALIFQFQSFLNSLHFPIEIVIQSKKLDLTPYLGKIRGLAQKQENELLKIQTEDYVDFVTQLINIANIMKKSFYVVVSFAPISVGKGGFFDNLFHHNELSVLRISEDEFQSHARDLNQKGQSIAAGLGSMGLHCRQLNTEEIIELFYSLYNPEISGKERLGETENISSTIVSVDREKQDETKISDQNTITPAIDNSAIVNETAKKREAKISELRQETEKEVERSSAIETAKASGEGAKPVSEKGIGLQDGTKGYDTKIENVAQSPAQNPPAQAANSAQPQPAPQVSKEQMKAIKDPNVNKNYGW